MAGSLTDDEAFWADVPSPDGFPLSTGEKVVELFDWYPWLRPLYTPFERRYNADDVHEAFKKLTPHVPIAACVLYLLFCVLGSRAMRNRKAWDLRRPLIAWNFGLALFSFIGAFRVVPHLLQALYVYGFKYTLCSNPRVGYGMGASGVWIQAFIFSKIPELGDTFFIVMRKKPLIFLHWYHHVTVLLYCWHSYYYQMSYGIYFVSMNYTVHGVMYLYYALKALRIDLCRPVYITIMQISQMFVGIFVVASGAYYYNQGHNKYINLKNMWAGAVMYSSYAALFLQYAVRRFVRRLRHGKHSVGGSLKSPLASVARARQVSAAGPETGAGPGSDPGSCSSFSGGSPWKEDGALGGRGGVEVKKGPSSSAASAPFSGSPQDSSGGRRSSRRSSRLAQQSNGSGGSSTTGNSSNGDCSSNGGSANGKVPSPRRENLRAKVE